MPPKRKHAEDAASVETTSSTRSTRRSTRHTNQSSSAATTAKPPPAKKVALSGTDDREHPLKTISADSESKSKKATKTSKAAKTRSQKSSAKNGSSSLANDDDARPVTSVPPNLLSKTSTQSKTSASKAQSAAQNFSSESYTPERSLALFRTFVDEDEPRVIGPEGFERLCSEAGIALDGALPLILSWQMESKEMMKLTEEGWKHGSHLLKASTLPQLALAMNDLQDVLMFDKPPLKKSGKPDPYDRSTYYKYCENKQAAFQKFYMFCFLLAKPEQSRNIDMETATALWSVLLAPKFPIMLEITEFINQNATTYKAVNKDVWNMMLEFCRVVKPDLSNYEGEEAWPTLLDDFVSWKKKGRTQA